MLLAVLSVLAALPARAADDDLPSFRNRGDDEKKFVTEVGIAIVKTARWGPTGHELDSYKIEPTRAAEPRKDLHIVVSWKGGLKKKTFHSTIVVHVRVISEKEWEVLSIDHDEDCKAWFGMPAQANMLDLIKKFNR